MDYQKAKDIRGKKFSELMTDKLVAGEGIGSSFTKTISERSKARFTGLKEKFDPLNIAKVLTGGSRLGPALLGKMTGASKERMSYFAGDPKKKKIEALASGIKPESLEMATTSLGNIYELLKKDKEEKKLQRQLSYSKEEEQEFEEDRRNQELIKALTARVKPRKKKKVEEKKAEEPEKPAPAPARKRKRKGKAPTKTVPKTTEKPTAPTPAAPKPTAPAPKPTPAAPKPTAPAPKPTPAAPKPTAPAPKPTAPAPKPTPAAPKPTAAPAPKSPTITTAQKVSKGAAITGALTAAAGLVTAALTSAGLSKKAQANVLAQVEAESAFKPKNENLNYTSAERIQKTFGTRRIPSIQYAETLVGNPEKLAEAVYGKDTAAGKSLGNTEPGDGWKYRGRGFLQHTGKGQYIEIKKYTGIDVVSNPDLLNDPEVAAKAIPWFFLSYKKLNPANLENISTVNKAVGFSDPSGEKAVAREKLALKYAEKDLSIPTSVSTGSQIDTASKENKDLKSSLNKDRPKQTVVNNTTVNSEMQNVSPSTENVVDDRPALIKKRDS
jgi:predicted chitinase